MKKNLINLLIGLFTLLILSCSTEDLELQQMKQSDLNPLLAQAGQHEMKGATQISSVGEAIFVSDLATCNFADQGADFAIQLEGDLVGCLLVFVESAECSPSGTHIEQGEEYFMGTFNGEEGTFRTSYRFEAKWEDCPALSGEIFGRCQNPVQSKSGTGVFTGVSGRLDFRTILRGAHCHIEDI